MMRPAPGRRDAQGADVIPIYFPPREPGRKPVPLAEVCGPAGERSQGVLYSRRFDDLFNQGPSLWESAPIERARLVVYPHDFKENEHTRACAAMARQAGLPCLFFDSSDTHTPCAPGHGTVYRSAVFLSQMTAAERAMPPTCEDLLLYRDGRPQPRAKGPRPVVGFCGYLVPAWKSAMLRLRGERDKADGHDVRRRSVASLRGSPLVDTNFLIRASYWGGAIRARQDAALVARVRDEFVDNMFGCDYVLCARGAGNFSLRFYETLSAGRIPLLINTDCALPLSDRIDWKAHCVVVEWNRVREASRILADFHGSLSDRRFAELQAANRELWDRLLNPLSFLKLAVQEAVTGHGPRGPLG
jgi:hypothetical protein